jgi:putative CocE/NonD family hydrolase
MDTEQSQAEYGIIVAQNVMIPMRDGVQLATDIYRPANPDGTPVEGAFPVILGRTSYDKSNPVIWVDPIARFFVPRGYVVLLQDLRGRGLSEGTGQYFHTANPLEGKDGYDTIEWAAKQEWSTGRTGMVGASHGGIVQNMASLERPPHLSALWVDVAPTNAFKWEARQGGAMGLHMYGALYLHSYDAQEIRDDLDAIKRIEEGAENLREMVCKTPFKPGETPIAAVPNLEKVLFHYYYDGVYNEFWSQECLDQTPHFGRMKDIPAVYSSGWYDPFAADVAEQFAHMAAQNETPQRLVLGPWNHGGMRGAGSTAVGEVDFGAAARWGNEVFNGERLRWFDRWLKDIDTGVEDDAPVRFFVMGGGDGRKNEAGKMNHGGRWRSEKAWPLAQAVQTVYYLQPGGGLSIAEPAQDGAAASWVHDPEYPVPSVGGNVTGMYEWVKLPQSMDRAYVPGRARMNSIIADGPLHQKEGPDLVRAQPPYPLLAERPDVMVFQTQPLAVDVEVTGGMEVRLWISSSAVDTDFTAKLIDVHPANEDYPDGFHMPLADSILRTRFRAGFDAERFMEPGQVYEISIELPPIANLFKAGHCIRVDIASSNFPRFDINPNTGEALGRHTKLIKATNNVYTDALHPSHIRLPVMAG